MAQLLLVALGGAFGALARFKLSGFFLHRYANASFPLGTFTCNVVGCLAIGVFAALAEKHHWFSPDTRILIITGFLGAFTTFSAFGYETMYLARRGEMFVAGSYVASSVCFGLLAVWIGHRLAGG